MTELPQTYIGRVEMLWITKMSKTHKANIKK